MLRVTNKIIAAPLLALTTTVAAAGANKVNSKVTANNPQELKIYEQNNKSENKTTIPWELALTLGTLGGFAGALAAGRVGNKSEKQIKIEDNQSFLKGAALQEYLADREKFFNVENSVLESVQDIPTYIMTSQYSDSIEKFSKKYPHTKEYLNLTLLPYCDRRLNIDEASFLFRALFYKAVATPEEWANALDYAFIDLCVNYEEMVEDVIQRSMLEEKAKIEMEEEFRQAQAAEESAARKTSQQEQEEELEKEKVHSFATTPRDIKFTNVGAQKDAIGKLKKSILYPIKYPHAFEKLPVKHGFVLYGPPGTGKTLLAEALANECGAHYIKLIGSELSSKWVGDTEKNWKQVFEEAKKNQPSLIFIDEFDSVASKRGQGDVHGDKAQNQVLGLLSDVEKNNDQVYIIAATNMLDLIDPAFIRSGRLGVHIELKSPQSVEDVKEIFNIHTEDKSLDNDVNKDEICKKLTRMSLSGADIALIANNALENALLRLKIYEKMDDGSFDDRKDLDLKIKQEDFLKAIEDFNNEKFKKTKIGFN